MKGGPSNPSIAQDRLPPRNGPRTDRQAHQRRRSDDRDGTATEGGSARQTGPPANACCPNALPAEGRSNGFGPSPETRAPTARRRPAVGESIPNSCARALSGASARPVASPRRGLAARVWVRIRHEATAPTPASRARRRTGNQNRRRPDPTAPNAPSPGGLGSSHSARIAAGAPDGPPRANDAAWPSLSGRRESGGEYPDPPPEAASSREGSTNRSGPAETPTAAGAAPGGRVSRRPANLA